MQQPTMKIYYVLMMYDLIPEEDAYGSSIEEPFYQFVLKIKNPSKC
jgi:hypothetical protein